MATFVLVSADEQSGGGGLVGALPPRSIRANQFRI